MLRSVRFVREGMIEARSGHVCHLGMMKFVINSFGLLLFIYFRNCFFFTLFFSLRWHRHQGCSRYHVITSYIRRTAQQRFSPGKSLFWMMMIMDVVNLKGYYEK
jgi:hypothetical protein